jgi:hypothetical protein
VCFLNIFFGRTFSVFAVCCVLLPLPSAFCPLPFFFGRRPSSAALVSDLLHQPCQPPPGNSLLSFNSLGLGFKVGVWVRVRVKVGVSVRVRIKVRVRFMLKGLYFFFVIHLEQ